MLGGCGFEPLYGPGSAAGELHGNLLVEVDGERVGFLIEEELERQFGHAVAPDYRLEVELELQESEAAFAGSGGIERYELSGVGTFSVRSRSSGEVLYGGDVSGRVNWAATRETLQTVTARRAAQERLARTIADRIVRRLFLTAEDWQT